MAKGAADAQLMGRLHTTLASVFEKVLLKYEMDLAVTAKFSERDDQGNLIADEVMAEIVAALGMPSPAMLSAISKFLADNSILYNDEDLNKLSAHEERLAAMQKRRGSVVSIGNLPLATNG